MITTFTPENNRRRIAWLPEHLVASLILGQADHSHIQIARPINLPPNVKVVTTFTEPMRRAWGVVLQSDDWEQVPTGEQPPEVKIEFQVVRLARRDSDAWLELHPKLGHRISDLLFESLALNAELWLTSEQAKELASRMQWLEAVASTADAVVTQGKESDAAADTKAWDALAGLLQPGHKESEVPSHV